MTDQTGRNMTRDEWLIEFNRLRKVWAEAQDKWALSILTKNRVYRVNCWAELIQAGHDVFKFTAVNDYEDT